MKLKVTFSIDPTGMTKDIIEEIILPSNTCLICEIHGSTRHNAEYLLEEVKNELIKKGYSPHYIISVYTI